MGGATFHAQIKARRGVAGNWKTYIETCREGGISMKEHIAQMRNHSVDWKQLVKELKENRAADTIGSGGNLSSAEHATKFKEAIRSHRWKPEDHERMRKGAQHKRDRLLRQTAIREQHLDIEVRQRGPRR